VKNQDKKSLIDYVEVIVKRRGFIVRTVVAITMILIIISFMIQEQFTATVTILPPSSEQQSMIGIMSTVMGSDISRLASLGGGLQGMTTLSDLFAAIMKSGNIRNRVIDKLDLMSIFKVDKKIDAHKMLDEMTRITILPEGIIAVSVTYHDKYLASDIANAHVEELDRFNTETAMTMGKKYRIFIETQLKETKDSLLISEENLQNFQSKHKTIALQKELETAIEGVAQLKSQIIVLEVQKSVMLPSAQLNNPILQNIDRQLNELKRQLAEIEVGGGNKDGFGAGFSMPFMELPELSLEYARLLREVKVQEAIYEVLVQHYEQAKIMEAKDTPTVQILDLAGPPEEKSYPQRKRIALIALCGGIILSVGLTFFMERLAIARRQKDSTLLRWYAIIGKIKSDFKVFIEPVKKRITWKK
jgi:tyrosine-protein kinase Etk/Wzc